MENIIANHPRLRVSGIQILQSQRNKTTWVECLDHIAIISSLFRITSKLKAEFRTTRNSIIK